MCENTKAERGGNDYRGRERDDHGGVCVASFIRAAIDRVVSSNKERERVSRVNTPTHAC